MLMLAAACAAALSLTSPAWAAAKPIGGTPIRISEPRQGTIAEATTDDDGSAVFHDLKPGHYQLVVDGPGLVAAMDTPERKSGSSFSIGVGGGIFGGGSSRSHGQGAHGGSGGGVGVGISVPLPGSDDRHSQETWHDGGDTLHADIGWDRHDATGDASGISLDSPLCRACAKQDIHIGFTVPDGAPRDVKLSIFDRWGEQ